MREGQGYDSDYTYFGVFCLETGDMIYSYFGDEMHIDRGGRRNSGTSAIRIIESKVSMNRLRKLINNPATYFTLLPNQAKRTLYDYVCCDAIAVHIGSSVFIFFLSHRLFFHQLRTETVAKVEEEGYDFRYSYDPLPVAVGVTADGSSRFFFLEFVFLVCFSPLFLILFP